MQSKQALDALMNLKVSIESRYRVSSLAHFGRRLIARSISFNTGYSYAQLAPCKVSETHIRDIDGKVPAAQVGLDGVVDRRAVVMDEVRELLEVV